MPHRGRASSALSRSDRRAGFPYGHVETIEPEGDATVRTRLFHAKKKLSEALARQGLR
jgi:hypothetical protein